ncbi:cardio acceleratory peptide 2b-like isoform X2 [Periplaneta americana]|uniref:Capa protein n=1 Tax=Periplaneta americana TaxID=6978 RepID=A0A0C4MK77_PERAM|nr:CAPA [Periplaneta americana]
MSQILIFCATIHLILLVSSIHCNGDPTNSKNRRGSSSGLISMPRVGRAFLTLTPGSHVDSYVEAKRGASGLIPVMRNGRTDPLWQLPGAHLEQYLSGKRGASGLIPVMRNGRTDPLWSLSADAVFDDDGTVLSVPGKRGGGGSGETSGMWFGPRLGKRSKRSADFPWTLVTVREFPADSRDYTPRLGRESEEQEDCCDLTDDDSQSSQNGRSPHSHN